MKLTWVKCQCGSPSCRYQFPMEIGSFYQGTGFRSQEVAMIDAAFEALDAAKTFVERVDKGEVQSKRTYAQMKAILAKAGML